MSQDQAEKSWKNNRYFAIAIKVIAAVFSGLFIYQAGFGVWVPQYSRGLYILFAMVLAFLIAPHRKGKKTPPVWVQALDLVFAALSVVCILYFISRFQHYSINAGIPLEPIDLVFGILTIVLLLEACRRCLGWALPVITILFLLYCYFGRVMPGQLAHRGFSINRIVNVMYAGTEGIFGSVTYTFSTYIFLFIIFGSFLQVSGAGDFYIELAKAAVGRLSGGAGQASVVSSWILGSIMGSSTANTAVTGAVTIPLMIENGYKKHVAASIEAVVSIGGQFMPPIMGAAAFLMAANIGVPYGEIALAGLPSAVLFFLAMIFMVWLEAKRTGLKPIPAAEIPRMRDVMKKGWFYLLPIAVIVYFLGTGASPSKAGFWSIVSCVVVSWFNPGKRMKFPELFEALADGAKSSLSISASAGVIGILIASISLPGLGMKLSSLIMQVSGGVLPLALLLVMLASFILGMGMNVSSAYMLLITLTAPALTQLGVPILVAHFFVFWTSQLAVVTPPVALSAYVAASIAGADVWKTGWYSLRMGLVIYYMPILFVYMPALLLVGSVGEIIYALVCTFIGIFAFSVLCQGFLITKATWLERIMMGIATFMLILIGWVTDLIGLALIAAVIIMQVVRKRKQTPDDSGAEPAAAQAV